MFRLKNVTDINRITVEFKLPLRTLRLRSLKILIESQWNLNEKLPDEVIKVDQILIESQWNLNDDVVVVYMTHLDINRITVEFKYMKYIRSGYFRFYINRITVEFK